MILGLVNYYMCTFVSNILLTTNLLKNLKFDLFSDEENFKDVKSRYKFRVDIETLPCYVNLVILSLNYSCLPESFCDCQVTKVFMIISRQVLLKLASLPHIVN